MRCPRRLGATARTCGEPGMRRGEAVRPRLPRVGPDRRDQQWRTGARRVECTRGATACAMCPRARAYGGERMAELPRGHRYAATARKRVRLVAATTVKRKSGTFCADFARSCRIVKRPCPRVTPAWRTILPARLPERMPAHRYPRRGCGRCRISPAVRRGLGQRSAARRNLDGTPSEQRSADLPARGRCSPHVHPRFDPSRPAIITILLPAAGHRYN